MTEATDQNIRKLYSAVFFFSSRKQTLQFDFLRKCIENNMGNMHADIRV